ncbi:MAG: FAD-dependent oxidoreductase [Acidimicrobiia bacterium]
MPGTVLVVGAGVFGVTSALELAERGWQVTLLDQGPAPHPLAASTDISKMIRADYGDDEHYIELMELAFPGWREWNRRWGTDLFHETGFLILAGGPMEPGGFEHSSFEVLAGRGYPVESLAHDDIRAHYPAWRPPAGVEGYLSPVAGWAESGAVVQRLLGEARQAGVEIRTGSAAELLIDGSAVGGVRLGPEEVIEREVTLVAAGAWTIDLVPSTTDLISTVGQPVIHFQPEDPEAFRPPAFPPWAADIGTLGWYGFPATEAGVVKVANHGAGRELPPDAERLVGDRWEKLFREFLAGWIPSLAEAPVAADRLCLYTDTTDGDFLIDRHPDLSGLVLATGGSGHGFKFAPVLGGLAADAVEGRDNSFLDRFRWRTATESRTEAARGTGPSPTADL